jgi:hypothetical protein
MSGVLNLDAILYNESHGMPIRADVAYGPRRSRECLLSRQLLRAKMG